MSDLQMSTVRQLPRHWCPKSGIIYLVCSTPIYT